MMEAEGGGWCSEGERRREAEERDIKMSSNGVSSLSAWGKLQLQREAAKMHKQPCAVDGAHQREGI